jgi:hypothetical protein
MSPMSGEDYIFQKHFKIFRDRGAIAEACTFTLIGLGIDHILPRMPVNSGSRGSRPVAGFRCRIQTINGER